MIFLNMVMSMPKLKKAIYDNLVFILISCIDTKKTIDE